MMAGQRSWILSLWTPVRPERLAAVRILLAVATCVYLAGLFDLREEYFAGDGWLTPEAREAGWSVGRWTLVPASATREWLTGFFALGFASAISLALGYRSRISALCCFAVVASLQARNFLQLYAGDTVFRVGLLLLALSPCGAAWSLDARRLPKPTRVNAIGLRLLQAQVALIYVTTAFAKSFGEAWVSGSAVKLALMVPLARFDFTPLATVDWLNPIWAALTWSVLFWEMAFPLFFLAPWTRRGAIAFGVAFHACVAFATVLHEFSLAMLALYPVLVSEKDWEEASKRVGLI